MIAGDCCRLRARLVAEVLFVPHYLYFLPDGVKHNVVAYALDSEKVFAAAVGGGVPPQKQIAVLFRLGQRHVLTVSRPYYVGRIHFAPFRLQGYGKQPVRLDVRRRKQHIAHVGNVHLLHKAARFVLPAQKHAAQNGALRKRQRFAEGNFEFGIPHLPVFQQEGSSVAVQGDGVQHRLEAGVQRRDTLHVAAVNLRYFIAVDVRPPLEHVPRLAQRQQFHDVAVRHLVGVDLRTVVGAVVQVIHHGVYLGREHGVQHGVLLHSVQHLDVLAAAVSGGVPPHKVVAMLLCGSKQVHVACQHLARIISGHAAAVRFVTYAEGAPFLLPQRIQRKVAAPADFFVSVAPFGRVVPAEKHVAAAHGNVERHLVVGDGFGIAFYKHAAVKHVAHGALIVAPTRVKTYVVALARHRGDRFAAVI